MDMSIALDANNNANNRCKNYGIIGDDDESQHRASNTTTAITTFRATAFSKSPLSSSPSIISWTRRDGSLSSSIRLGGCSDVIGDMLGASAPSPSSAVASQSKPLLTQSASSGAALSKPGRDDKRPVLRRQSYANNTTPLAFNEPSSSVCTFTRASIPIELNNNNISMKLPVSPTSGPAIGNNHNNYHDSSTDQSWSRPWPSFPNPGSGSSDSSYDSDQDSNPNSGGENLKQLVNDLLDSGNSTTPEYETSNLKFSTDNIFDDNTDIILNDKFHQRLAHGEVNRTNSETLGLEYREYVTRQMLPGSNCSLAAQNVINTIECVTSSTEDEDGFESNECDLEFHTILNSNPANLAAYHSNLNYGKKLGYSKRHVHSALKKLGLIVEKNELLEELISIFDQDTSGSRSTLKLHNYDHTPRPQRPSGLRPIVIDGSNVAASHGNKQFFSCRGIEIVVQWFQARGHRDITVFVPKWRIENTFHSKTLPSKDTPILKRLENEGIVFSTPSRCVDGQLQATHDDHFIVDLATRNNGIIVSNDNFRDFLGKSDSVNKVIKERLLMYTFVKDEFMPPDDPLGRNGPRLNTFLRMNTTGEAKYQRLCPYDKKCTYGIKCKYLHPERDPAACRLPLAEQLSVSSKRSLSKGKIPLKSMNSLPVHLHPGSGEQPAQKNGLCRTKSNHVDIPPTSSCGGGNNVTNGVVRTPMTLNTHPKPEHRKLQRTNALEGRPSISGLQNCNFETMTNKLKLSQAKSCGSSTFSSFDSSGASCNSNSYLNIAVQAAQLPNRQFSHSTRNLNSETFTTPSLSPFQQQQRQSYLHLQQQQQHPHNNSGTLHCQQQQQYQNRLVKSFSLSSPSPAICSMQQSNPNSNITAANNKHYISGTDLFSLAPKVSMPSVTITAETPVTSNAAFDAFDSNHQFHRSASAQPLQQALSFCSSGSAANSIRSTPPATLNSGPFAGSPFQSQSQLLPNCGFSSSSSMLACSSQGANHNSISNQHRKHSGVCSPVMPPVAHQTVSRNLSAPESQSHNQLHPQFGNGNTNHLLHQSPTSSQNSQSSQSFMMFPSSSSNNSISPDQRPSFGLVVQRASNGSIGGSSSNSMESIDKERSRIMFHLSSLYQDREQVIRAMEFLGPTETNINVIIEQIMKQQQQQ